jgi:transposase
VIEINQPHPHTKARRGKSDTIDAEAAARKVLSGEATGAAKDTSGIVEAIRQLTVAMNGAIKARAAAPCQLGDLLVTAPVPVREQLALRKTLEAKAAICARMRPDPKTPTDPTTAAKFALRRVACRIATLTAEAAELAAQLEQLVCVLAAPITLQQLGLGPHNTAALLIAAGKNIGRFGSEAAFAHLCGVAPVPASSGRTTRHRLNHGGNREANRALHMAVIVRLRYCARTHTYMARRPTEGKTKKEIIRCLKRYLVREVYRTLRADLGTLATRT